MTGIVMDASAIGAALLPDEGGALGALAYDSWQSSRVCVPAHWPIEVASVLIKAEREKRISTAECLQAWSFAATLVQSAQVEDSVPADAVFKLARKHVISAQDAAYLELAIRLELPLLTGDKALARAAKTSAVPLPYRIGVR